MKIKLKIGRIIKAAAKADKSLHMGKKACIGVVSTFIVVYFFSMLLVTYLEKEDIEVKYNQIVNDAAENFQKYEYEYDTTASAASYEKADESENYLRDALYKCWYSVQNGSFMMSVAVYDDSGTLLMQSHNQIRFEADVGEWFTYMDLEEFMTEDEIQKLAYYVGKNAEREDQRYDLYVYQVLLSKGGIPAYIDVIEPKFITYTAREDEVDQLLENLGDEISDGYSSSVFPDGSREIRIENGEEVVWSWKNPDISYENIVYTPLSAAFNFSGMEGGYGIWQKWMNDDYFQDFPEQTEPNDGSHGFWERIDSGSRYEIRATIDPPGYMSGAYDGRYTLIMRVRQHPWLAAMDSLKYIYLGSFIFLAVCMTAVLWIMERTYRQREQMDAQRRDFINTMAHEIKTPLSVICGFSENLKENPNTKKHEYYLDQMIRQTEEIDGLVKEMITTSQVDWKQVKIGSDPISLRNVIECETDRLEARTEERRLNVTMRCEDDWVLQGDRRLLEQAFFSILSNAVSYNRDEGRIRIVLRNGNCTIENTGENIPPEHLPHVCEMFYTVNQSKTGREKHLGMGLYLARQIFLLHGVSLKVENTEEGVRVTVEKKG